MTQQPIRVGIIGASADPWAWASRAHMPALQSLPDYDVVAVASRSQANADAAARTHGIPRAYGRYIDMVESSEIDMVCVSTSSAHHRELVVPAIAAGKHVFCEWPFGVDIVQSIEMRDLAAERGVRTAVGLQNRYAPTVAYVRDLITQGFIGTLYAVNLSRSSDQTAQKAVSTEYWQFLETARAGLRILAGHALDTLAAYVGEFVDLQAYLEAEMSEITLADTGQLAPVTDHDHILVQGRLYEGAVVSVVVKKNSPSHRGFHLEISGSDGAIVVTVADGADTQDRQPGVPNDLVIHGTSVLGEPFERLSVPSSYRTVPVETPDDQATNVAMMYQRFAAAVGDGTPFETDFDHGVMRRQLLETITRAADTGTRTSFSPA